jgi:hypothetical protein
MAFLRTHPVFTLLVAMAALVLAAEAGLLVVNGREARRLEARIAERIAEIERLQAQRPFPDMANVRAARDDFAANGEDLATMLRALNVSGADELDYFKGEPADRTAAYFDIAAFVDTMRHAAAEAGVAAGPDERFGFSAYANEGPEADVSRSVYRQRRIVEYLMRALFAARPRALVSVQREEPLRLAVPGAAAPAASPRPASAGGGRDFFVVDPQVSARTPGYVDTMAFRIAFTGQTSALRGFMNALAVPDLPLVVRSVEVADPAADPTRSGSGRPAAAAARPAAPGPEALPASVPIVAENSTQFVVTVEFFEVKIRPPVIPAEEALPP